MVNYGNGKIYKIVPICDHDEGDVYFGSTTKWYLCQRMDTHRLDYTLHQYGRKVRLSVFDLFDKYGVNNCQIVLVENYPCNSKNELHAREAHYIRSMKCVNKVIPLRTKKEYYEDTKEHYSCPCGSEILLAHKARHEKSVKHQTYLDTKSDNPSDEANPN